MRHRFLIVIIFISQFTLAQDFIVTLKGDTLKGEVIIELPSDHYDEIQIKTDDEKIRLKAYQLLSLVKDSIVYKPVKYADKYHLMKLISDGYLSHYQYRNGTYDFGINFLLKVDGDGMEVPNISFKKGMSEFLSECTELSEKISNKELTRKDLEEIIIEYNGCIDRNTVKTQLNVTKVVDAENTTLKLLSELQSNIPSENEELLTLIKDISGKIAEGETIPSYLISVLKNQTSEMPNLKEQVEAIITALK